VFCLFVVVDVEPKENGLSFFSLSRVTHSLQHPALARHSALYSKPHYNTWYLRTIPRVLPTENSHPCINTPFPDQSATGPLGCRLGVKKKQRSKEDNILYCCNGFIIISAVSALLKAFAWSLLNGLIFLSVEMPSSTGHFLRAVPNGLG